MSAEPPEETGGFSFYPASDSWTKEMFAGKSRKMAVCPGILVTGNH
jgi:hypothetical protein